MENQQMNIGARQDNHEPIWLANLHQHRPPTAHEPITGRHGTCHNEKLEEPKSHSTEEYFDCGSNEEYSEDMYYGITGSSPEDFGKSLEEIQNESTCEFAIGVNEVMQHQPKLLTSDGLCTLQRNEVATENDREQEYISKEAFKKPCLTQLPPLEPYFHPSQLTSVFGNSPYCFPISSFTAQAQPVAFSEEELMRASFPVFSCMDQATSSTEELERKDLHNAFFAKFSVEDLISMKLILCNNDNVAKNYNIVASELHAKNRISQDGESLENDSVIKRSENTDYHESERLRVSSLGSNDNMANATFSDCEWLKFPEQIKCLSGEESIGDVQTKKISKTSTGKIKSSLSRCNPGKSKHTVERKVSRAVCKKRNKTQEKSTVREKKRCFVSGCLKFAQTGGKCVAHGGGKRCVVAGCDRYALSSTKCYAHGVRKICTVTDCTKSAMPGGKCFVHGGGKKCAKEGCTKYAKIGGKCVAHGGGRRCLEIGCAKSAQAGGRCVNHGGVSKRCSEVGCPKSAKKGGKCIAHGGGKRCSEAGCTKSAQVGGKCTAHGDSTYTPICDIPNVSSLSEISW